MYQVIMFDGGVYRIKELYELIEDIGGFVLQKTQVQVMITITMAIPEEDRGIIEAKSRELGGKLIDVPLAGTEIVVVGPTLGRHHMPHPICDMAEQLRRYGAITVVMGLARGKGRDTSQISAEERAIIEEYDAAVFMVGNFKDCIVKEKIHLFEKIEIPVVVTCGPPLEALPNCEGLVTGVGRKAERMRRPDEIQKLEEVSSAVERVIARRRQVIDEDPLFVHPAEVKERLEEIPEVAESLRPAPIVLHADGLRVKVPYEQFAEKIGNVEIYGRRLQDIAVLRPSKTQGTIIRIKAKSEVEAG